MKVAWTARWHDSIARTVRRGQRRGVFRADLEVEAITVMREMLVEFVAREPLDSARSRPGESSAN
ncbi:hypothetical protein GCM10023321_53040 [Pseudonocardia eucalypti]|uniref:TetR family transcriptional regulator n=1 Tax=Pseudonocardia eucalypti TaxID=648755 RepID=A0ABP9QMU4_9PSEU|nr:hypothetical protein [Pseudonocardia eucalypti]